MGANSAIGWTRHTFNIAWGCVESPSGGCDHCYARDFAKRYGYDVWGKNAERRVMSDKYWREPLKWNAAAEKEGGHVRVFSSSMTDVFLNDPVIDREREKLWPLIEQTPALDWLLLTKHPERIAANLPDTWGEGWPNVWLGVTVENNAAGWRADILRKIPARVRFLSVEPLLGPVDMVDLTGIGWVIVGGESGPHARPMNPNWARAMRDRCIDADIPFFFKQHGEYAPLDDDGAEGRGFHRPLVEIGDSVVTRFGKHRAGNVLDGQVWEQVPTFADAA